MRVLCLGGGPAGLYFALLMKLRNPTQVVTVVERNRLRRRLRELARIRLIPFHSELDVVIRSLPTAYDASFSALTKEIDEIGRQLGEQTEPA